MKKRKGCGPTRRRRVALVEYTTRSREEPPDHIHTTEDEIFYVLQGALPFKCGDETCGPGADPLAGPAANHASGRARRTDRIDGGDRGDGSQRWGRTVRRR